MVSRVFDVKIWTAYGPITKGLLYAYQMGLCVKHAKNNYYKHFYRSQHQNDQRFCGFKKIENGLIVNQYGGQD